MSFSSGPFWGVSCSARGTTARKRECLCKGHMSDVPSKVHKHTALYTAAVVAHLALWAAECGRPDLHNMRQSAGITRCRTSQWHHQAFQRFTCGLVAPCSMATAANTTTKVLWIATQ
jgi:hypothetical protein